MPTEEEWESANRLVEAKTGRARTEFTPEDQSWVAFLAGALEQVVEVSVAEVRKALRV
jgi:hypothetical protein